MQAILTFLTPTSNGAVTFRERERERDRERERETEIRVVMQS